MKPKNSRPTARIVDIGLGGIKRKELQKSPKVGKSGSPKEGRPKVQKSIANVQDLGV